MTCSAVRHDTTYAYERFRCRCPEAVRRVRIARRSRVLPKGTFRYPKILGGVDQMAVERACAGDRDVQLTVAEMRVVVDELTRLGKSASQIAIRLGVSPRTVQRYRTQMRGGGMTPGPNDSLPCGSTDPVVLDAVRRRHLAKGERCVVCDVSVDGPPADLYRNWRML